MEKYLRLFCFFLLYFFLFFGKNKTGNFKNKFKKIYLYIFDIFAKARENLYTVFLRHIDVKML
ncbi:TPA: hypothetical protein DDZ01_01775 [Candidatus Uhrbacteria bacterium]|nr:hypothetical protein [Candidatus Uhrbacteria bacterium]HCB55998.1 hypothetical protein [Candidatus Uhrbacteria bacterium]